MDQLLSSHELEPQSAGRGLQPPPVRSGQRCINNNDASTENPPALSEGMLDSARLIRMPAVRERIGLGRTAVYELIKLGRFPRPVKVGAVSAWIDVEITRWIEQLAVKRDKPG